MTLQRLVCVSVFVFVAVPVRAGQSKKAMVDMQSVPITPARQESVARVKPPSGPALTLDAFTVRQEARLQAIIDRQIIYLQRMVKLSSPDDPQLPDYYFRLGELYTEKYRYWNNRARQLDEAIYRAEHGGDTGTAVPRRQEQKRYEERAEQAVLEAIRHFVVIVRGGPYARMDEALYRLGYALALAGHPERARDAFHRLVKDYPQSRYVPDAYLAFAEDAFAKGDMAQALAFYSKVTQFPQSAVAGFALYKRAWAEANLGDFRAGLASLTELLARCQAGTIAEPARRPLEKEARRDLVRMYARTPGADADRAFDFFRRIAGGEAHRMLLALADVYWDEGMAASSSRVYRKVMALDPRSPFLCAWQDKVLRNTLSTGDETEQIRELERLGNAFRYVRSLPDIKADILGECRSRYSESARQMAFVLHKQAQRTQRLPTFRLAAAAYREYLGTFEADVNAAEVGFYCAECLWQVAALSPPNEALWRQAAEQYTRVIRLDPSGPFVKEAAYASVLAWQNVVYQNDDDLHPRGRRS